MTTEVVIGSGIKSHLLLGLDPIYLGSAICFQGQMC